MHGDTVGVIGIFVAIPLTQWSWGAAILIFAAALLIFVFQPKNS